MQYQKPVLVQGQQLRMNPQLYQSIQLMALPLQELKLRIDEELQANPALEVVEDNSTVSLEDGDQQTTEEQYEYFEDSSDPGITRTRYDDQASGNKRQFMEGALSRAETLREHLEWQLRLQPISDSEFTIGNTLIQNLDDNGFYREPLEVLFEEEEMAAVLKIIEIVRSFEPAGICVTDYRESLLVQAGFDENRPAAVDSILTDFLDLLERGKHAEVARKLKIEVEDVGEALDFIRGLTPFPGRLFSADQVTYVIPDLMVVLRDSQFLIIMNEEEIPVLGVSDGFKEIGKEPQKDVKRFVRAKVKDAKWFIQSIRQRNATLLKVARAIIEFQRDYFLKGAKYLVPLTLKDIAAEVRVHEATVSRITTSKYMQTEWGIYELKYFFTNSISGAGSTGSRFSKVGVKEVIREILEDEATDKHLSDQGIADLLASRGINLARRTVAKYRNELDIYSSYRR